jgi:hypothetical protein
MGPRPANLHLGVFVGILAVGCWRATPPPEQLKNSDTRAAEPSVVGPYWCSIQQDEFDYPPMRCVIREQGGRLHLAKLDGSQRFRGVVRPTSRGLAFDGELYCPWGACGRAVRAEFERMPGETAMRATFYDGMTVTLVPAGSAVGSDVSDGGFGGFSYGGAAYGGWGVGGLAPTPTPMPGP